MDESPLSGSVKVPLYQAAAAWAPHIWLDPNGSQLLPVIAHTAHARDATEAAAGAQSSTRWGSHFGARRGYCVTPVKLRLAWATLLGQRGEILMEGVFIQNRKHHLRFYQSKLPTCSFKLHERDNKGPLQRFKNSKACCCFDSLRLFLSLSVFLSLIHFSSPSFGIYMSMTFV